MRVYRYLSEQELNKILSGDTSTLGAEFYSKKKSKEFCNNHHYKKI